MKIGIIGYGNMGQAIVARTKEKYALTVCDADSAKTAGAEGVEVAADALSLVNACDAIMIAVKPQDCDALISTIKDAVGKKLVMSIVAGKPTWYFETGLSGSRRVVRVMPNLPVKIGKGTICIADQESAPEEDFQFVREFFSCCGTTVMMREKLFSAATAIAGSGPGFIFSLLADVPADKWDYQAKEALRPALFNAGVDMGFEVMVADKLARSTLEGSMALLRESGLSPKELCEQVTSEGGTTEAGLARLQGDVRQMRFAVRAAAERAEELAG